VLSLGSYLLGAAQLAVVGFSLGFAAYRLRARLLPEWEGAPARLVEAIVAVALLIWISEILGTFALFYAGVLVGACLLVAGTVALWPAGPVGAASPTVLGGGAASAPRGTPAAPPPPGESIWRLLIMVGVIALVVGHWALTTKSALDRGVFNFDSLWYHLPFAVEMVQTHSVTGIHHVDTVFTNWFYPQNSELLHAVGMLVTERDVTSLFLNYGWLAVAFLAAWCIGRPYGRGSLSVVAAAILLEAHILVVREPGAAKNDLMAAALLLAAIAILITAWNLRRLKDATDARDERPADGPKTHAYGGKPAHRPGGLPVGWGVGVAGLAVGLAAGTKVTALAMAAALSLAVLALAPAGRRWATAGWWFVPALLGGGYWYLRNLVVAGNPLPAVESVGPISLPHPERLQIGRPDFSIAHYATDTGVWSEYFAPGLHDAFGALWPLVLAGALAAALLALVRGRDRVVRWIGAVALFGLVAYVFTPLSAAGAEGAPEAFGINIRYLYGALLGALVLLPLPRFFDPGRRQWWLLGALLAVLLLTDRGDGVLRDPDRPFALLVVVLAVVVPAALLLARGRGTSRGIVVAGFAALALAIVAVGYPLQRHYLDERFRNEAAAESIPGMSLDSAYRWARSTGDARIGLAGTSAGFARYGFYGTDLSNRVVYLGEEGPHGAFNAIPDCSAFRAAVNAADLDYLVTAPFLNFLDPGRPIASPEARWLRAERAVVPVLRSGPVAVWKVRGELDVAGCGSRNAPLREIPDTGPG
jgi:hypothetical protein